MLLGLFLDSLYDSIRYLSLFDLVHIVWCPQDLSMLLQMASFSSFLWSNNIPVCVCMYYISFIHSSIDGHWGWFHIFNIINDAALNMGAHVLLSYYFCFLWIKSRSGIAASYNNSVLNFLRSFHMVFHSIFINLHSTNSSQGAAFLHFLTNSCYFFHFW